MSALGALGVVSRARLAEARGGFSGDSALEDLVQRTLRAAEKAGASYADVRVVRRAFETVSTRENRVEGVSARESYGLGVRVITGGAWGFAATSHVEPAAAAETAARAVGIARTNSAILRHPVTLAPNPVHVDVWQTALTKNPFRISPAEKAEYLLALNAEAMKVKGVKFAQSTVSSALEWKVFASSEGSYLEQEIVRISPRFSATAVDSSSGEFEQRSHEIPPRQAGWEYVEGSTLQADARRIGEEAVERLRAPSVTPGKRDLILHPSNLWLTIHESVGHSTELDRVLGFEANFAGTSFATLDKLNRLRFAAPEVNFYADKTTPGGLATCGYDDEGVRCQRWDLIRRGILVGYQTTREQARWIGETTSRGASYAQDFRSFPFQRMPNVSLAPYPGTRTLDDIIAATEDGVLVIGTGSWSIDHQRYNFQFGGQTFKEVKKGKVVRALRDVAYQSNTVEFWNSCDLIGDARSWELHGSFDDGKGEPSQSNAVSHGCPPARFRGVNILNTNTRGHA